MNHQHRSVPAPMTAAQHALLRRISRADQGLGVPLLMTDALVLKAMTRHWIIPAPRPWARDKKTMRFRLTDLGRRRMRNHETGCKTLRNTPRRRLPRA